MAMTISGSTGLTFPNTTTQASGAKVLQVVQGSTNTVAIVATTTYTDTNLTATITPTSATSKILVIVDQSTTVGRQATSVFGGIRLLRGSTVLYAPVEDANGPYEIGIQTAGLGGSLTELFLFTRVPITFLDSPNTTSATTYKTQGRPYQSVNFGEVAFNDSFSFITLMEIAA